MAPKGNQYDERGMNNIFFNFSDGCDRKIFEIKVSAEVQTEQFTILWILFVMIVLGNSAVLLTLSLNKRRKSRMNFFIKQLAIADLTVGLISVLTDIIWRITVTWHAGNVACKLIRFLQATVTYSSTYVLVALSIDRYDAITHPMNFTGSWRRARVLVISAWLISILFSVPEIFLFEEKPIEGQLQCWIELQPWQWQVYMTLITVALLIAPAIIISACYTIIVRTIWSKSKLLVPIGVTHHQLQQNHQASRRRQSRCDLRSVRQYEDHDTRRASSRGIIPKAKIKTVKMTFVIVFVFVLCWSPYIVFDLLQVYGHIPRTQTSTAVATLIQSLAPLNSAANPVIYCLFSTHTCRTLRKLFPLKWLSGCPGFESGSSHCLGGSDNSSRTVTTSLTQHSSRRSTTMATTHTIRMQTTNNSAASAAAAMQPNNKHCKVAISVV
ncbi:Crustacean cardioactive peptide receptor [Carabus blaptoides fortunei]